MGGTSSFFLGPRAVVVVVVVGKSFALIRLPGPSVRDSTGMTAFFVESTFIERKQSLDWPG